MKLNFGHILTLLSVGCSDCKNQSSVVEIDCNGIDRLRKVRVCNGSLSIKGDVKESK